jgi:excisionase family DNA binding protein
MTPSEAAAYLRVNPTTIHRWVREHRLPIYELATGGGRRFRRVDLDALAVRSLTREDVAGGLNALQPRMADVNRWNGRNQEFQTVAIMVRDASAGQPIPPGSGTEVWLGKAEETNPPGTEEGWLVREAATLLRARLREPEHYLTSDVEQVRRVIDAPMEWHRSLGIAVYEGVGEDGELLWGVDGPNATDRDYFTREGSSLRHVVRIWQRGQTSSIEPGSLRRDRSGRTAGGEGAS